MPDRQRNPRRRLVEGDRRDVDPVGGVVGAIAGDEVPDLAGAVIANRQPELAGGVGVLDHLEQSSGGRAARWIEDPRNISRELRPRYPGIQRVPEAHIAGQFWLS